LPSEAVAHFLSWNPCWPVRAILAEIDALEKARELSRQSLFGAIQVGIDTERDVDGTRVTGPTLEIGLPFFDRNQAARARIDAAIDSARDRQEAVMHSVLIDVAEAHARWVAARREYQVIEAELLPQRREVSRLSLERYNGMLLGVYDLLKARSAEVEAERAATRALRDFWIEHAELELLCGTKLDDPKIWEEVPRIERSKSADAEADAAANGELPADWRTVRFDSSPPKSDAPAESTEHEHHH
jgi:outer membrane protein TolC